MPRELGVHSRYGRLLVQCRVAELEQLTPLALGSRHLGQLPTPPPIGGGNRLQFWGTLLHGGLIGEGYDNRRYKVSRTTGCLVTTSLCGGVRQPDTWESWEGDGAQRGASSINLRSADIGVEENEREDCVLMMNSILVT